MDILIKNMKMPKSCEGCPFTKKVCDIYFTDKKTGVKTPYHYVDSCSLTGSWFDPFSDDSPKPCPLVALPSHGDLIDRDALIKDSWASYMLKKKNDDSSRVQYDTLMGYEIRNLIEDAPVIVEATE